MIVLLHDGRIVKGVLSEEDATYVVTQPIGVMRFPKKRVEKVLASIQEVYSYKLEQLPEKISTSGSSWPAGAWNKKWSPRPGNNSMRSLQLSPKHAQARAMLDSLDQAQARLANRQRDPEVQQTGAELVESPAAERPNTLDTTVIYGARRGMGISELPVIFDLPTSQAVKRTDEFARYVHPVLQSVLCSLSQRRVRRRVPARPDQEQAGSNKGRPRGPTLMRR